MKKALLHYYRQARQRQIETYRCGGEYINGRNTRKFTGGSAYYGCHAEAAINQARGQIHLRAMLRKKRR